MMLRHSGPVIKPSIALMEEMHRRVAPDVMRCPASGRLPPGASTSSLFSLPVIQGGRCHLLWNDDVRRLTIDDVWRGGDDKLVQTPLLVFLHLACNLAALMLRVARTIHLFLQQSKHGQDIGQEEIRRRGRGRSEVGGCDPQ